MYGYCTCQDWMNNSGDHDYPDVDFWCKHMISASLWLHKNERIVNECGSEQAKQLQDKLNGQSDSRENSDDRAQVLSSQLDPSDPFQLSELLDIDQIEGRRDDELAWKLQNGEYCISYAGVMKLAEKHRIEFDVIQIDEKTDTVIAQAKRNGSSRISGKAINRSVHTAIELAKRNAARQLLPLPEIKAIEKKVQLESEFSWQKAYDKCAKLAGGKAQVDIIINDLVNWGKLRKDNPSHYNRTEWLLIHDYCQKEASITRDPKSVNNWSYNSAVFLERCQEAIGKVRAEKKVEANEQPLEGGNGKEQVSKPASAINSKQKGW